MDALIQAAWRVYPATALFIIGLAAAARRQPRDPMRALAILQGFRASLIGLTLAGIGAAWLWHLNWLLGLSLIIGGQELLEATVVITALRQGTRRRQDHRAVSTLMDQRA